MSGIARGSPVRVDSQRGHDFLWVQRWTLSTCDPKCFKTNLRTSHMYTCYRILASPWRRGGIYAGGRGWAGGSNQVPGWFQSKILILDQQSNPWFDSSNSFKWATNQRLSVKRNTPTWLNQWLLSTAKNTIRIIVHPWLKWTKTRK